MTSTIRIMLMQAEPDAHARWEEDLLPRLHDEEQARYRGFSGARRQSWLAGRVLLLAAVEEVLGKSRPELLRTAPEGGVTYAPGLHLSLSHSGGWLAAALADHAVGVDIERVRPRAVSAHAHRLFTADEARWLESQPQDARLESFYVLWTLKEAACKAAGLSIWDSLRHAGFDVGAGRARLVEPLPPGPWHFMQAEFAPAWRIAVALRGAVNPRFDCARRGPDRHWQPQPLAGATYLSG